MGIWEDFLRANSVNIIVLNDEKCLKSMKDFIAKNPEIWNEDIGKSENCKI